MQKRVSILREISENTTPKISMERARLLTQAMKQAPEEWSENVKRAYGFWHIMAHKSLYYEPGELIVGERGEAPWAAPTYPELCCHTEEDLRLVHSRDRIRFDVSEETLREHLDEIVPFWRERSIRQRIIENMTPQWQSAYKAGIFTEFMEQRSPGHTVADKKVFTMGMSDFQERIDQRLEVLESLEEGEDQKAEIAALQAMRMASEAIVIYAKRYSQALKAQAEALAEDSPVEAQILMEMSRICDKVPQKKPETFHEALQHYWFIHLGVITELNTWDAFSPGRLDQHLWPFYEAELAAGTISRDHAKLLLGCFWVKFNNQPAPPKVGVTLKESSTYTDFANISLGGLTAQGEDGANPMTYILLEVIDEMRLLQPSTNVQISAQNPDAMVLGALDVIKAGRGQPSLFNADAVVKEMLRQGKRLEDAREGGTSGCVETGAFGKESYILTGYFNLVKVLDLTLHNGFDPFTNEQLGPKTGEAASFKSLDDLFEAYSQQLDYFLAIKLEGNHTIENIYAKYMPCPFLSILIDDCIEKGRDYNNGGARYHSRYIQGVGIGTLTDSLSALERHVFTRDVSEGHVPLGQLIEAMDDNFEGASDLHQRLLTQTPHYGNDLDAADHLMQRAFDLYFSKVDGLPSPTGGTYRINMLPTTCHVYFGSVIGATPDGRLAHTPLSEGISPVQGRDVSGPTAVVLSAAKMDHLRTGGTLLNMKFEPSLLKEAVGLVAVKDLVRTYFLLDGHHIQFNVVDRETLLAAQKNPEGYRDLIVRVAGYSDYFNNLQKPLQDEIIARTSWGHF